MDTVGFGPVGKTESYRLSVKIGELKGTKVVFKVLATVGEGLHKTAQFIGFEGLLETGVTTTHTGILIVGGCVHPTIVLHVVKPSQTGLAIVTNPLSDFRVIHPKVGKDAIVRSPPPLHTLRINLVILEVHELLGIVFPKGNLSGPTNISRYHTLTNKIHNVNNTSNGNSLPTVLIENHTNTIMEVL